jgi:proliferating cell nuclear antigen
MEFKICDKKKKDSFISLFNLLKNSSSQINATFDKNNLHIQGMDKSHICLFELNLSEQWFNSYNVSEKLNLCFDSNIFYSMISTKSDEQSLIVKTISDDTLGIELINQEKKGDYNKFFNIQLNEYEYEELIVPSTEYDAELLLPSKKITDVFSQISNFGDDISIICYDECVDFTTNNTSGSMRVNISIDDMISYSIVEGEQIKLLYSLNYINKMCITNKLSNEIEFSLSNEYPMKIKYDLGDNSSLKFYIAPKLSDD